MNKQQFIEKLRAKLQGLPQDDIDERVGFYIEIIDDKREEGALEQDAVAQIGTVEEIAAQIVAETPFSKIVKEQLKPKRKFQTWEIVLFILGFPLWFPLLISAFAVTLSCYVVVWSLIIALWSVVISIIAAAFSSLLAGIVIFCMGKVTSGMFMFTAMLLCAGLGVCGWLGCKYATKGICVLTKHAAVGLKNKMIKKETAQ